MKKLFELQTNLTNYTYPLTKIAVSMFIILFSIFRKSLFVISSKPLDFLVTLFCFVATLASILCIYISIPELFYVWKNKKVKQEGVEFMTTTSFDLERVINLVKENDIIEFEIKSTGGIIKVGSSTDCKVGDSVFFDKRFYIEENEYLTSEEFETEILRHTVDGKLNVISIDGVKAEKW